MTLFPESSSQGPWSVPMNSGRRKCTRDQEKRVPFGKNLTRLPDTGLSPRSIFKTGLVVFAGFRVMLMVRMSDAARFHLHIPVISRARNLAPVRRADA